MGTVYRAYDRELDEEIAVKVLARAFTLNPSDVKRLKREIKTARRVSHPNVIRIHDFGIGERDAFISMELLDGGTLADLEAQGRVAFGRAAQIAVEICEGIAAAHEAGVIHRDVKPHNVLFNDEGRVKILDFGIARLATQDTITAGVLGTPHYMSPEQADGLDVDARSDVYSVGVLLYELFTGDLPFRASAFTKLLMMHVNDPPRPPSEVDPSIPAALETVILKCLEKDPKKRYADGGALADVVREVVEDAGAELGMTVAVRPRASRLRRAPWWRTPGPWIGVGVAAAASLFAASFANRDPAPIETSLTQIPTATIVATAATAAPQGPTATPTATPTPTPLPVVVPGLLAFVPVPHVQVEAVFIDGKPVAAEKKRYYFAMLSPGRHRVVVKAAGAERPFSVIVHTGKTRLYRVDLDADRSKAIELDQTYSGTDRDTALQRLRSSYSREEEE